MAGDANWLEVEARKLAAHARDDEKKVAVAIVRLPYARVEALLKEFGATNPELKVQFAGLRPHLHPTTPPGATLWSLARDVPQQETAVALMIAPTDPDSDG